MLDLWLGDPAWCPHIVVLFGRCIAAGEHCLNRGAWRRTKGALLAVTLTAAAFAATWWLLHGLALVAGCTGTLLLSGLLIWQCLAGTTLVREVRAVFRALEESTEAGRRQVARIVGRDTSDLTAQEVRTAALETLAENLNDGVVAPLFWLALLGVPGMVAYKMVNTLDSMLGYRTERYARFGTWAARMDDVAGFVPARLTALLMALSHPRTSLSTLRFVGLYGGAHASPNSGHPEAALAGMLHCRFGGIHSYFGQQVDKPYIGTEERELTAQDACFAIGVNRRVECMMVVLTVGLRYMMETV